jgi:parvulin-like peptidyl-prolyl isomerase
MVEELLAEKAKAKRPNEAEVLAAYHAGADGAKLQVVVRASREDAQGALDRLRKGSPLAEEAKASVEAGTRERGGEVGWLARGAIPAKVAADAFDGPLGTWRGPYDVDGRWFVVRTLERKVGNERNDAAGLAHARGRLEAERQEKARAAYVMQLRDRAKVRLDEKFVATAAGRTPTPADRDHAVARVGARSLRYGEVLDAVGPAEGHARVEAAAAMQLAVARQQVDRMLLEDAAEKAKVEKNPRVEKALAAAREEILVGAYYDAIAARTPAPTPVEVQARYEARSAEFTTPPSRRCAHLLASSEERAAALKGRVARGEPFDRVAREASEDQESAAKGGDLGEVPDERLQRLDPSIAALIRQLEPGALGGPVQSRLGWHVVRCDPLPPRMRPLAEVQDRISASIRHERIKAAMDSRVAELKAASR